MSSVYPIRSQARDAAKRAGYPNFRTYQDATTGGWRFRRADGLCPAAHYVGKEYVSHVETTEDGQGVIVITCLFGEIEGAIEPDILVEPITPSLFDRTSPKDQQRAPAERVFASGERSGSRTRSTNASPVKTVWGIADAMHAEGRATRQNVVTAAIDAGVHKATAGAQFRYWQIKNNLR